MVGGGGGGGYHGGGGGGVGTRGTDPYIFICIYLFNCVHIVIHLFWGL